MGNVSIGKVHGIHELDVSGHVFVQSDGTATKTFTQPGVHTIRIPQFVSTLQVQLIGAGGVSANGGGGGYIRGTIDVSGFGGQTLTIQVGSLGSGLCSPSTSSYLTFLPAGPLLTVAGAGGNGFNGVVLGVIAAGGNGGGGSFDGSGVANGSAGAISSVNATSGGGGSSVGGTAAASPPGTIVYQTPQPGQGRPTPENYIEANGGTGGFNESCGPAGGSGYAGGGQGLFAATTGGTFLAGGGGGGSSYVGARLSNITSYAGGSVPSGVISGYGRGNQGGCVVITYTDIPSLQTNGDIVCGGNLRVDGQITGPLDVSGALSVDILNVRKVINDVNRTTSISTDIVRTTGLLVGSEDPNITPAAAIHVLGGMVKVEGNISCNTLNYGALNPDVVHSVSTSAGSGVSIGGTAANPTISVFVRGMIMMFSGPSAPSGWAFCNGTNGTPDLRDRFIVGAGNTYAQGATGGEATVKLLTEHLPVHKHLIDDPGHTHSTKGYWNIAGGAGGKAASVSSVDYGIGTNFNAIFSASTGITETRNEGSDQAHENRPPYYALAYIMKL
jgi:microcystin-dependent protein